MRWPLQQPPHVVSSTPIPAMTDLERILILYASHSFKIGQDGKRLFYLAGRKRGYIVRSERAWKFLQLVDALGGLPGIVPAGCAGLLLLAFGANPEAVTLVTSTLVLSSIVSMVAIGLWAWRSLEVSSEAMTAADIASIRAVVLNQGLRLTLAVGFLGVLAACGALMARQFEANTIAASLLAGALLLLGYFGYRLSRRADASAGRDIGSLRR
jgi:hypothetical protein